MTKREQLIEQYEDALFALLMDSVAEEEGKHIAQEICDQEAAKATASSQRAREALPQAVAYILERVKA